VVAICATNHGELLDRAAWRRFQLRLTLDPPSRAQATEFLEKLRVRVGGSLGLAPRTLADKLAGASYAEIEQFTQDVMRRYVLTLPDERIEDVSAIVYNSVRT
jgi:SpoVK/Ycf46/Vps4 family AAA+-type ATPase